LSEEKKQYYYGGKEKKASDIRRREQGMVPYSFGDVQRDFDTMMERFQREFDDFWSAPLRWRSQMRFPLMSFKEEAVPSMDLEDRGKDFRVTVDLPGFKKEDVEIEVTDDSLVVKAEKTQSEEEKKKKYVRRERMARMAQTYYRKVTLPEEIRSDDAKANLTDGSLEITLPKKMPKESKKVKIS
jgi:HSP20 family protein